MKRCDAEITLNQQPPNRFRETVDSITNIQIGETLEEINQKTLTIRDQFAIAALQGMLSGQFPNELDEELYSSRAYILADAMLEARNS